MIGFLVLGLTTLSQAALLYWFFSVWFFSAPLSPEQKKQKLKDDNDRQMERLRAELVELITSRQWRNVFDWMVQRPRLLQAETEIDATSQIPLLYLLLLYKAPEKLVDYMLRYTPANSVKDDIGQTALHWVTGRLFTDRNILQKITRGYPEECVSQADRNGWTPFVLLCGQSDWKVALGMLTEYAQFIAESRKEKAEFRYLHIACSIPAVPTHTLKSLIREHPNWLATPGVCGRLPIQIYCQTTHFLEKPTTVANHLELLLLNSALERSKELCTNLFWDACEAGWFWNEGLALLLFLAPDALKDDRRQGLPPALLVTSAHTTRKGAHSERTSLSMLDTVYELLHAAPEQLLSSR